MGKRRALEDYSAMRKEFDNASDRAVAILGAAYVEEAVLDALLTELGIEDPNNIDELLGNGAPLSTFSNKIMMASVLGLTGPRTRGDLDRIRKIRNECAHSVNPISFADQKIMSWAAALTPRSLPIPHSEKYLPDASKPRERFQECCHQIYDQLYNDDRSYDHGKGANVVFGFELD